ncbi:uncharacterized protein [Dermacentor albipictus]|uniref:uncharacterized protein isoform X1 n=1 Tax=Dermacentor albipictus TaxID=60249 RepID=UPI0038FC207E
MSDNHSVDAGEQIEQERPQNTPHHCCVEKNFQRHVLRLLNTLRFMLEQQADTLNKLCDMLPTSSVTECADLLSHPLSSLEELQEFDDKLDAGKFKILMLLAKRQMQLLLTLRPLSNRGSGMLPSALPPSFRSQSQDYLSRQQILTETVTTAEGSRLPASDCLVILWILMAADSQWQRQGPCTVGNQLNHNFMVVFLNRCATSTLQYNTFPLKNVKGAVTIRVLQVASTLGI